MARPLVTSNCHPCHGQVKTLPSSNPCPNGPPRCRQVLLMAYTFPSTLAIAMAFPSTWSSRTVPGGTSPSFTVLTNPMLPPLPYVSTYNHLKLSSCLKAIPTPAVGHAALDAGHCSLGSATCATITFFLNSCTIRGSRRTSVGRFASVILSILSCSFSSA